MNEDWNVYFTQVEGRPASMFLNLAHEDAVSGLSTMLFFTLYLKDPDENGMSKRSEFDKLMEIEDVLVPALINEKCLFVGRCTSGGQRDFFFYMDSEAGVEKKLEDVMARFEEYDWDAGFADELDWETYFEFLYPDDQELDGILNNRVRAQLSEQGDNLGEPREIDHWMFFPLAEERDAVTVKLMAEGFRVKDTDEEGKSFGILAQRDDAPTELDAVTWHLRELAAGHSGNYDGWGCTVVG